MTESTTPDTPATPRMSLTQPSTSMSTPTTMLTGSTANNYHYQNNNETKLPFQTTYEEFEKFISEISNSDINSQLEEDNDGFAVFESPQTPKTTRVSIPNPQSFGKHLNNVSHLEMRLNYRFLELEAKLRFLKFLTAGTELSSTELISLDQDSENLTLKIENLEVQIKEMKKMGRIIRKKIGKCFHQSEIRRCIEGKPILEGEINSMIDNIAQFKQFFEQNGIENGIGVTDDVVEWAKQLLGENEVLGLDLIESNLEKTVLELDELEKTLNDLQNTSQSISKEDEELDVELAALENEKTELEEKLLDLENHEITLEESELIKQHKMLNQLVGIWETI